MEILVGLAVLWVFFALFGVWVAGKKNRSELEGATLGLLFGPFGWLIELLLPTLESKPQ